MSMDLIGISNKNEYYTNHYFTSIFEENASETISKWRAEAKESDTIRTPWAKLRDVNKKYYPIHNRYLESRFDTRRLIDIQELADSFLDALGYPEAAPMWVHVADDAEVPVYLELKKSNGAPYMWVLLATSEDKSAGVLEKYSFSVDKLNEDFIQIVPDDALCYVPLEELSDKIFFDMTEPPRFILMIGMNQLALIDRNKWNEKRYLQFELEDIFGRNEETTLQAMAVLLHKDSICPEDGSVLLDELDSNSQKHASGVSQDLKYALRESIELLGNEVLYDMAHRLGRDFETDPVDAGELTLQCLRYMYRMLFMLFIEARPELGYAPIKNQSYASGYSLESLRDIADNVRDDIEEVGEGSYLHETLAKLYDLIYNGYPKTESEVQKFSKEQSIHDMFVIAPLKAHIFDPEYTKAITQAKLRNKVLLRIVDLMSVTRPSGKRNSRRGRISYSNLGINQLGAVYEALLSYRGFIAETDLYEVKRAGDSFNELDVGYFVKESELDQYAEDERVRYEHGENRGKLRMYKKGTFIYRLAGREREKSASYYTPESLTKCLVKYALKELLEGKTADEILELTVCEPAMGSAAFLNEAVNQLAEAYLDRKQRELHQTIPHDIRQKELQKVKMYIADRNIYGIDLNPVAVELAEVSLWLNTIFEGGYVPWFGTQLINGNSLIGARRECYKESALRATSKGLRWYEQAPERLSFVKTKTGKFSSKRDGKIYHFLLGDPGMCNYTDKVIKSLEPENIKLIKTWNKDFIKPYSDDEIKSLKDLSKIIDSLWQVQIQDQKNLETYTADSIAIYGQDGSADEIVSTIREKDKFLTGIYKSVRAQNAGAYARLKFAMDYWCSLWFWPISQADLLPSRAEFLNEMNWILEGTVDTSSGIQLSVFDNEDKIDTGVQLSIFDDDNIVAKRVVNLDSLCAIFPRLQLVRSISAQNHFMHWELEFANLFAERGGFDIILGNPPWVKIKWEEKGVLSDANPLFVIRNLSAKQTSEQRFETLQNTLIRDQYYIEYELISGQQNYINSNQNYSSLRGLQGNLYECFLPQSWTFLNPDGVFALIHPESVFNDSKGSQIRYELNKRLIKHFRFSNALKLFENVHTSREFGLNIYSNKASYQFDQIVNLYSASTIDDCYENDINSSISIRDANGKRNIRGQKSRITTIGRDELLLFSHILDNGEDWKSARLLSIYSKDLIDILKIFDKQTRKLSDLQNDLFSCMLWDETNAQKDGTIVRNVHFGDSLDTILSGAHIGSSNPLFNCSNAGCKGNNDNTSIDLSIIGRSYIQRTNYSFNLSIDDYLRRIPSTPWETKYTDEYRLVCRKMIDLEGERTLMPCLIPPRIGHTNGIIGFSFRDESQLILSLGAFSSLPFDYFIKACGKGNLQMNTAGMLPLINNDSELANEISIRALLLNCLTSYYSDIWNRTFFDSYRTLSWAKVDERLKIDTFSKLSNTWEASYPLRYAFERRQAMVELDVLVAMELGMTIEQLKTAYRIQFYSLQQHERDTFYDSLGHIVYAKNNALTNVGFSRAEWENPNMVSPIRRGTGEWDGIMKHAPEGYVFARTIMDDTLPGGPVERTIEYVAPFDRCDREQDYETAWHFFEEKYGNKGN